MEMSFHDNKVHGIEFIDEDYSCLFVIDIDHIQEWIKEESTFSFKIQPSKLVFADVSSFSIKMERTNLTINSYLDTILNIESAPVEGKNVRMYVIEMLGGNCIELESTGYSLEYFGKSVVKSEQYLTKSERGNA